MAKNSFTLIELVIVVAMVLVLSTFSFAWYGNMTQEKTLSQSEMQLKTILETAKVGAETGNTSYCTSPSTAYLSAFSAVISGGTIQLRPFCNTVPTIVTYKTDSHIVFLQPSQEIRFDTLGHTTDTCITVQYHNSTHNKYIRVNQSGLITSDMSCTPTP
jgi:type II secretory pathway pseudopilin PulG